MLHDPKREAEIAEQLFEQSLEGWQRYLLTIADILQTYGWIRGNFGCDQKGYCAIGANSRAHAMLRHIGVACEDLTKQSSRAMDELEEYTRGKKECGIVYWNDRVCKSKEQIIYTCQLVALGG